MQRYNYRHKKFTECETDHVTRIKEISQTEPEIDLILKSFKPINIPGIKINGTNKKKQKEEKKFR